MSRNQASGPGLYDRIILKFSSTCGGTRALEQGLAAFLQEHEKHDQQRVLACLLVLSRIAS